MSYGDYIKQKRLEKKYSQRKLGLISGVSNTTISRMESNETEKPEVDTLKAIEKALELSQNEIINIAYPPVKNISQLKSNDNIKIDSTKKDDIELTKKDKREIEKILEDTEKALLEGDGLMFNGEPASDEAIQSIISAMRIGVEMAKKESKKKFTPKKYRKNDDE